MQNHVMTHMINIKDNIAAISNLIVVDKEKDPPSVVIFITNSKLRNHCLQLSGREGAQGGFIGLRCSAASARFDVSKDRSIDIQFLFFNPQRPKLVQHQSCA